MSQPTLRTELPANKQIAYEACHVYQLLLQQQKAADL